MKIISLKSENFKKLKAVEIIPHENTVIISGKNGQGKTSVLDSIFVALCGKQKDLLKPIREGENTSIINVELDKYFVKRIFKQGSTKLEVISKDGEIMASPQTLLDTIVGSLAFDPLAFANLNTKDQRSTLLRLTKLDLENYEKERKNLYDLRHEVGQSLKGMPEINLSDLATAQQKVVEGKKDLQKLFADLTMQREKKIFTTAQAEKRSRAIIRITAIDQQIAALIDELEKLKKEVSHIDEVMAVNSFDDQLISQLTNDLSTAESHNNAVDSAMKQLEQAKKRQEAQKIYDDYTAKITVLDNERTRAISEAKMPIVGLGFDDDGVTYNKIPFTQLSGAEKLKVSMAIAMAMNPELRVIRILDGSLLDDDNMKVIREMATSEDFQVWIERVDSSGKVGFYIEEGEVKADNQ